jgi:Restriction endonuclease
MSLKDAAILVLKEAQSPLHANAITKRMLDAGLWSTDGKTPEATVGARLYVDIKRNGVASPFVKIAPSVFVLRDGGAAAAAKTAPKPERNPAAPKRKSVSFSFVDCAQKALEKYGEKKPMHYREITRMALENGWLSASGKTPEASLYAQVITEIQREQKRGEQPRFVQHGGGLVGLSKWMGRGLAMQIEKSNAQVRTQLRERLFAMKPGDFETLVSQLLTAMGFEMVEVTKLSGDGGIDVRGTLVVGDVVRIKMAVQAKRWKLKSHVQSPTVQQVRGSLGAHEQGLIITTSDFSAGAKEEAAQSDKTPIALMNGEQLVLLLMEHRIGVRSSSPDLFELDEDFRNEP